ncbi:MAG: radical SAM family heme chaperone HemW [Deltaproteobacteria bacterium]|nr:radical SAM family heme chaperone HemW [Deltaproteobacteria bacterium]
MNPGLYIHVPFCGSKCPYCGFYSIASHSLITRWMKAIKREISYYRGSFGEFDSLYLGGGTPSFLEIKDIGDIMDHLSRSFRFTGGTEITLEANPGDISKDKVRAFKSIGFNRINLGVQSFDDRELTFLGRRHSAEEAERSINCLRSEGFDNVGVDLIYGVEGQSIRDWSKSLDKTVSFKPEHISCYQLNIEMKTPFWKKRERGGLKDLSEEEEVEFFNFTSGFLERKGYIHYEISNFARNESFMSRHNCKYWSHEPYLGLGPSAHSFSERDRWWNFSSIRRYCDAIEKGEAPIEGREVLTDEQIALETLSLGFRTRKGFEKEAVRHLPGSDDILSKLQDSNLARVEKDRIIPTRKGFLVADSLPLMFFK